MQSTVSESTLVLTAELGAEVIQMGGGYCPHTFWDNLSEAIWAIYQEAEEVGCLEEIKMWGEVSNAVHMCVRWLVQNPHRDGANDLVKQIEDMAIMFHKSGLFD